jgi:hypothetical protein
MLLSRCSRLSKVTTLYYILTLIDSCRSEIIDKEKKLIKGLITENTVLKKGICIQNKRIEDSIQKLQELEDLRRFSAQ